MQRLEHLHPPIQRIDDRDIRQRPVEQGQGRSRLEVVDATVQVSGHLIPCRLEGVPVRTDQADQLLLGRSLVTVLAETRGLLDNGVRAGRGHGFRFS